MTASEDDIVLPITTPTTPTAAPPTVLCGELSIDLTRRGPVLTLSVRCPACRGPHRHEWGLDTPEPTHRAAHCWRDSSPYRALDVGYYIFPADTEENRRTLERFAVLLRERGELPRSVGEAGSGSG